MYVLDLRQKAKEVLKRELKRQKERESEYMPTNEYLRDFATRQGYRGERERERARNPH